MEPSNLRPQWANVARRLQQAACNTRGVAIVHSRIVVDATGNPVGWSEPDVTRMEPLSQSNSLVNILSQGLLPNTPLDIRIATFLDARQIAVNKGANHGLTIPSWFAIIVEGDIHGILRAVEVRERIAILRSLWFSQTAPKLSVGDRVYQIEIPVSIDN